MERGKQIRHTEFKLEFDGFEDPVEHLKQGGQKTCIWMCKSEHQREYKAEDIESLC